MRLASPLALSLLAGTLSHALPPAQDKPTSTVSAAPSSVTFTAASTDTAVAADQLDQLSNFAQEQTNSTLSTNSKKRKGCSLSNVAVRREYSSLSKKERKSYTDAVLCLQKKRTKTPASLIPGSRSRFDDWVGTHLNQTLTIHYTGTFLAWHRYFIWQYEQALRNECGYTGYQPYWNWAKTAITGLENSPMLDGSDHSMSGNGEFIPGRGNVILGGNGLPEIAIPAGSGGGCVTSGPFKDMKVNLGPIALGLTNGSTVSNGDGLAYNPRCLKRDLTDYSNKKWANATSIVSLIVGNEDIESFQMQMQGVPGSGNIGVHGGGHYSIGGDPGRDLFISPGDPLFYLHHGMIDRAWWIWQQLDRKTRTSEKGISGTNTFLNTPPSANTTLDTLIDLGYSAGPPVTMNDLMSTTEGPMCYMYL
ncbi:Di-copper centre-containing protein [Didymella exigua CBS 183.55]|uniref:Di-copper centre-containing protein n=1 Tax=Didymella exigua CBS 183.55 TaxID=1150837 RepID=A0A6A5RPF7_9PLEO|nr:Di-copper centre-containing protein [Didymella exigua CBS 183.55]KAF1928176.1 Di-copper centre-containing protein [Didymella exigua CBS 183.55]